MLRSLPNGDLFAPQRGTAPECPQGYIRDDGNPFIFHPVLDDCQYRVEVPEKCNCGRDKIIKFCNRLQRKITLGECKNGVCKRVVH